MKSLTFFLIIAVSVSVYAKTEATLIVAGTSLLQNGQKRKVAAEDSMNAALSALIKLGEQKACNNGHSTYFADSGESSGAWTPAKAKAARAVAKQKDAKKSDAAFVTEGSK